MTTAPIAQIAVINESQAITDDAVAKYVGALQRQVSEHFAPIWGADAKLTVVPRSAHPEPGAWWLVLLDDSDQAGALGYHDLTNEHLPMGKVFAATDIKYGSSVSVTLSHEILEMLANPWLNRTVLTSRGSMASRIYALEVGDACEDDSLGYPIDGVLVSDFVTPEFFVELPPGGAQYDYCKHITAPFQILAGGYLGVLDFANPRNGWSQVNARDEYHRVANLAVLGSRRERAKVGSRHWVTSTAHRPSAVAV